MTKLTSRFDDAFKYAHDVHGAQVRKGNQAPYIGHLMGVTSIVLDDGGSEDEAIGALLHDAAEDQGGRARLDEIRARFGDAVAKIVEDCTDSWETPKRPWIDRKRDYVKHAHTLDASSLRVSAADKVHNCVRHPPRPAQHGGPGLVALQRAGRRRDGVLRIAGARVPALGRR